MSLTFVIADLHGRRDLLDLALQAVAGRGGGHVVLTGDYVDRGPHGRQVIERLMAGPPAGQRWTCLKGNHESIMVQACRDPALLGWWLRNGGGDTLASYGAAQGVAAGASRVPDSHLAWVDALPLFHADAHRAYVHAGVEPGLPLDRQSEETLLWKRYGRDEDPGFDGRHVVHGHQPYADGPVLLPGRTDLDTLAWRTGRLVMGVFDDGLPGGPAELVELRAALAT